MLNIYILHYIIYVFGTNSKFGGLITAGVGNNAFYIHVFFHVTELFFLPVHVNGQKTYECAKDGAENGSRKSVEPPSQEML